MKHTQGPWSIGFDGYNVSTIFGGDGLSIAMTYLPLNTRVSELPELEKNPKWAQAVADARLIAAAPDLLEACQAALNMVETDQGPPNWDLLRAAILKATTP